MTSSYRLLAAVALVKALWHMLFGRYVTVSKFGTVSVAGESHELALTDFNFEDQWLTGTMHCDGVTSDRYQDLLHRAAIAVAVTILIAGFHQQKRKL